MAAMSVLKLLTLDEDGTERRQGSLASNHSMLLMTQDLQDSYQAVVTESILPVLALILTNRNGLVQPSNEGTKAGSRTLDTETRVSIV
jgi:hypothetical protein